ncbi:MAG: NFACT family protein, partial [Cytophagales bacterium]
INLESDWALLFKMHGSQSNVILMREQKVVSIFKNQFEADWDIDIKQLNRTIDWSKESFFQSQENLKTKYFTLGREFWEYLGKLDFESKSVDVKWDMFESTLAQLRAPRFFVGYTHHKATFSLLPISNVIDQFTDPIEAVNSFFQLATTESALEVEKKSLLKYLQEQIKNKKSFAERNERKLGELLNDQHYQLWGDLIMANMHLVKPGMESVTLTNFYNQEQTNIKLKKRVECPA